jgi:hypothetical protein
MKGETQGGIPYASTWSPSKNATGVLATNRTISFHIQDDVDVLTANGVVNIEGTNYTCGSGVTCIGGGTNNLTATYTKGSDWSYDQVVNVSTSGFRDTEGNIMYQDTWSYTIQPNPYLPPNITTTSPLTTRTVSTAFTQDFAATAGTSPYTWSLLSGTLPPGTNLSPSGTFSGTPTTAGDYNFTALVTDNLSATDNQAFAIHINPITPGGQTTVKIPDDGGSFADTFINSGAADTNYSSSTESRVYQWPSYTVINRVLDNIVLGLPDNVSITEARLYMYLSGYDGSGADNPMTVYAYRSDPITPSTATWTNSSAVTKQASESSVGVTLTPGWVYWDVLTMTQWAYANASPLYIALDGWQVGAADTNRIFVSRDGAAANRPYLSVTYTSMVGGVSIPAPGKMRVSKMKGAFR